MEKTTGLRSADLKHIESCATPAIMSCFKTYGFKFTSTDVEEVLSETYVKVAMSYERYDSSISKKSWFSTIAWRCACSYITKEAERRKRFSPMEMKSTDGEYYELEYSDRECSKNSRADSSIISDENLEKIERACDALGEDNARVIRLHVQGYDNHEIAEQMGWTEGATKTRKSRAIKKLASNEVIQMLCKEQFAYREAV